MVTLIRLVLYIPLILLNAWALSSLWGWYIAPLVGFDIGMVQAWGLSLTAHFLLLVYPVSYIATAFWNRKNLLSSMKQCKSLCRLSILFSL